MTDTRRATLRLLAMIALLSSPGHGCHQRASTCADGRICPLGSECTADGNACIQGGCGNGALDRGEECDDGNIESGDGCSTACRRELAAGGGHTCATIPDKSDSGHGALRCWGLNWNGQLGRSDRRHRGDDEPALLDGVYVGGAVQQVVAGDSHTCALLASGAVRCWGLGDEGQLGYGNTDEVGDDEAPTAVGDVDLGDRVRGRVAQLAAGRYHTCALLVSGAVRCWGAGDDGQLGYGNRDNIGDDETPASAGDVNVAPDDAVVEQIAAGWDHTCALLSSGAVRCWGWGYDGQLGYGNSLSIGDDEPPAAAGDVDVGGRVTQLTAGYRHTCALLEPGNVRCWGRGRDGQLGYGDTDSVGNYEPPAGAGDIDVGGTVQELAAGGSHTCALLDSGQVRCWGFGDGGQLGYGNEDNIGDDETPASAGDVDIGGPVIHLAAFDDQTCALLSSGTVRCWGSALGGLGYGIGGAIGDDEVPSSAGDVDIGGPVAQLAIGASHRCALLRSGAVRCWGLGGDGQLGYGNTDMIGDDEAPGVLFAVDLGADIAQLATGAAHTCALVAGGAVYCWGRGREGQLGHGALHDIGDSEDPRTAGNVELGAPAQQIAAGDAHTCALMRSGAIRCWGSGEFGQLGYGHTETVGVHEFPDAVAPVQLNGNPVQVVAGARHTCALVDDGDVYCWGSGESGELGYGDLGPINLGDDEHPAAAGAVRVGGPVVQITAGGAHTCALLDSGAVRCWGRGDSGQLGHGERENLGDDEHPADRAAVPTGGPVVQITAGAEHTCALLDSGVIRCWGAGESGQLGQASTDNIGDDEPASAARDIVLDGAPVAIAAGDRHTCAMLDTGTIYCWGLGESGRLGHGPLGPAGPNIGDDETPDSVGPLPTR